MFCYSPVRQNIEILLFCSCGKAYLYVEESESLFGGQASYRDTNTLKCTKLHILINLLQRQLSNKTILSYPPKGLFTKRHG